MLRSSRFAIGVLGLGACSFSANVPRIADAEPDTVHDAPPDTEPCQTVSVGACPSNYVKVPNICAYNANEFCVMKYEAKVLNTAAVSVMTGFPTGNVTKAQAKAACEANGSRYHLITNDEWMATARAIEATPENWSLTTTPFLSKGKTDNCVGPCPGPPSCPQPAAADTAPCFTTTTGCDDRTNNAFRYNRTHRIFANGVIWDFSGNMFELVDHPFTMNATEGNNIGQDINSADGSKFAPPLMDAQYKSANLSHADVPTVSMQPQAPVQNIGILYVTSQEESPNFTRGGDFCGFAGIYSVSLLRDSELGANVGFRCAYK